MIVLEHTNPLTIYLDYHFDLPERGSSGYMVGDQFGGNTTAGPFISCNPTPTGEITLGSPLTKNKSTYSDYHYRDGNTSYRDGGCVYGEGESYWRENGGGTGGGLFFTSQDSSRFEIFAFFGSRLSLFSH